MIEYTAGTLVQTRQKSHVGGVICVVSGYPDRGSEGWRSLSHGDEYVRAEARTNKANEPETVYSEKVLAVSRMQDPVRLVQPYFQRREANVAHGRAFDERSPLSLM